jgi:hypothetical protein
MPVLAQTVLIQRCLQLRMRELLVRIKPGIAQHRIFDDCGDAVDLR